SSRCHRGRDGRCDCPVPKRTSEGDSAQRRPEAAPALVASHSPPEPPARDGGAFCERAEFGPDDVRIHPARSDMNAEAAVDAGHDVVAADEVCIPLDALRNELRMLDVVGLTLDDAWYQHFAFRHLDRFEHGPLMGVARVRRLEL